jgi:hypothetical protein
MDDALRMDIGKPFANVPEPANDLFLVYAILQLVRQGARLSVRGEDEVHLEIGHARVLVRDKIVDANDSRVLQVREDTPLGDETLAQKL